MSRLTSLFVVMMFLSGCAVMPEPDPGVPQHEQWTFPSRPNITFESCQPNKVCLSNEDAKDLRIWLEKVKQEAQKHGAVVADDSDTS